MKEDQDGPVDLAAVRRRLDTRPVEPVMTTEEKLAMLRRKLAEEK